MVIELERLDTAVRIERERSIVFPETSVIIRDIIKLQQALEPEAVVVAGGKPAIEQVFDEAGTTEAVEELDLLLQQLDGRS